MHSARLTPSFHDAAASTVLSRLIAPIGPALNGRASDAPTPPANPTWIAALSLAASLALLLIAAGDTASRNGEEAASLLFWAGVFLLLLPLAGRVAWPRVARSERLFLLLLLSESLFLYKLLYAPTAFVHYDEFLHWVTAHDILHRRQLFLENSLLPISAYYPGLEIVTTAIANLAGVSVFPASVAVIAVLRAAFMAALFLFYERLSGSSRLAGLASLIYMGSSTFAVFDSQFAYETLGLTLLMLVMCVETEHWESGQPTSARFTALVGLLLFALAITHHVSATWCALYLVGLALIERVRRARLPGRRISLLGVAAALSVLLPVAWVVIMRIPIVDYLGPIAARAITDVAAKLAGTSSARELFVASDGTVQPLGYRLAGIGATLLLSMGLATGFFRSLALAAGPGPMLGWSRLVIVAHRQWRNSRIVLLTLAALGFPISVALRLSGAGWEIGNRMSSVVFIAVGFVCAVAIVHFWQSRTTAVRVLGTTAALSVVLLGSITTGSGIRALPGGYRVSADAESIEPMGIATAQWAKTWLGEGNRFVADRINQLLLATYGQQDVVTTIAGGVDESRVYLAPDLSGDALYTIRAGKIDYLLADLRLTTSPPVLGHNFESDERGEGKAPPPNWLLKFDKAPWAGRVFDNGWIVIYDVSALRAGG
jgi:hypothetical protein